MVPLLWLTDPHLDHLAPGGAEALGEALARAHPRAETLVISGDLAHASALVSLLGELARGFRRQVAFVLGNHDYYMSSWEETDAALAAALASGRLPEPLVWLDQEPIWLPEGTALVGTTGWYDGEAGNPRTPVLLNDFLLIRELAHCRTRGALRARARARAAAGVAVLLDRLEAVLSSGAQRVLIVTHFPPFVGAAWHEGRVSGPDWLPWMSAPTLGAALLEFAERHDSVSFVVLCGHTHSPGEYTPRENLRVFTGRAEYGHPALAGVVDPLQLVVTLA